MNNGNKKNRLKVCPEQKSCDDIDKVVDNYNMFKALAPDTYSAYADSYRVNSLGHSFIANSALKNIKSVLIQCRSFNGNDAEYVISEIEGDAEDVENSIEELDSALKECCDHIEGLRSYTDTLEDIITSMLENPISRLEYLQDLNKHLDNEDVHDIIE